MSKPLWSEVEALQPTTARAIMWLSRLKRRRYTLTIISVFYAGIARDFRAEEMTMKLGTLVLVATACLSAATDAVAQARQPTIVLNGGNGMGLEITKPVLEMAGGSRAVIAVVVHAQGPGDMALDDWRRAQPAEVIPINVSNVATSARSSTEPR